MTSELINQAIQDAVIRQSKLEPVAFLPGGFTSPEIRHLMNNLGSLCKNYLEIGTHRGALSVATMYNNPHLKATLVDNWSEFNESDAMEDFHKFHQKFMPDAKVIEQDCFTIQADQLDAPYDLYLYDAGHGLEEQEKAITYFWPYMADKFILCVDDFNWSQVAIGTDNGLRLKRPSKVDSMYLTGPQWHNGYCVYLIEK